MSNPPLIERFKAFYQDMLATEWAVLDNIYSKEIIFCDPIHQIEGREMLYRYFDELCSNLVACRFEFLDEVILSDKAYLKWDMHFAHPKLGGKKTISVRGITQIQFDDSGIYYHEDIYDMGALLYENIPVLGTSVRWLKQRLAKVAS